MLRFSEGIESLLKVFLFSLKEIKRMGVFFQKCFFSYGISWYLGGPLALDKENMAVLAWSSTSGFL